MPRSRRNKSDDNESLISAENAMKTPIDPTDLTQPVKQHTDDGDNGSDGFHTDSVLSSIDQETASEKSNDWLVTEDVEHSAGCCGFMFPAGYKQEFKKTVSIMYGMVIVFICNTAMQPISVAFGGHLGRKELGAIATASMLINVAGSSIAVGLANAMDTLLSQTFGSKNKKRMGTQLQTSIIILGLAMLMCMCVHLNSETILILVGQDPAIARLTGEYTFYFLPGLIFMYASIILNRFLSAQSIVWPQVIACLWGLAIHALCQYLFLYRFELGIQGSAAAQVVGYMNIFFAMLAYSLHKGVFVDTWGGWSLACLERWGAFGQLAIAGMLMVCLEWWAFEILLILAGLLGDVALATQACVFNWSSLFFSIPGGMGITVCIRVGQELGAGRPLHAQTASRVTYTISLCVTTVVCILLISLRHQMPLVFTSDPEVAALAAKYLPLLALFRFFDDLSIVTRFGVRGMGKQVFGTVNTFICYYIIGLPISIALMFYTPLKGAGLWIGNTIGMFCALVMFAVYMFFWVDWRLVTREARIRAGVYTPKGKAAAEVKPDYTGDTTSGEECTEKTGLLKQRLPYDDEKSISVEGVKLTDPDRFSNKTYVHLLVLKRVLTILFFFLVFAMAIYTHITVKLEQSPWGHYRNTTATDTIPVMFGNNTKIDLNLNDNTTTLTTYFFLPHKNVMEL